MKRRKNWKKAACLLTMMCMLGSASACEVSFDQKDTEKTETVKEEKVSLEDRGLEVIEIMNEKIHSEAYSKMLLTSSLMDTEAYQKLKECTYDTPDKIYRITMADDAIDNLLKIETNTDVDLESLSSNLREVFYTQIFGSYMNIINSKAGAEALAVQSCFASDKMFVSDEKNLKCMYVYEYADQYPIAVVFIGSEDGAARAIGYFVLNEDVKAGSLEELQQSILVRGLAESNELKEAIGFQIEQIKQIK